MNELHTLGALSAFVVAAWVGGCSRDEPERSAPLPPPAASAPAPATGDVAAPDHTAEVEDAIAAAGKWLALLDAGRHDESWAAAATPFREAVSQERWRAAAQAVRGPLGELSTRELVASEYETVLPGAPPGSYVVIRFRTTFARGVVTETVTPMRDADGAWRVSGYYVR